MVVANNEQRTLAAIMFTDMVGYSALTQRNETLAIELLEEHFQILRGLLPQHQGKEIKTTGDGLFAEFSSALSAVQCAVEIQRILTKRNQSKSADHQVRIRIGIHLGDVVRRGNEALGDGVNIAARIEPLAAPGGICISEDVARQIRNKVSYRIDVLDRVKLKNIELPVAVHRIVLPWETPELTASSSESRARSGRRTVITVVVVLCVLAVAIVAFVKTARKVHSEPKPKKHLTFVLEAVDAIKVNVALTNDFLFVRNFTNAVDGGKVLLIPIVPGTSNVTIQFSVVNNWTGIVSDAEVVLSSVPSLNCLKNDFWEPSYVTDSEEIGKAWTTFCPRPLYVGDRLPLGPLELSASHRAQVAAPYPVHMLIRANKQHKPLVWISFGLTFVTSTSVSNTGIYRAINPEPTNGIAGIVFLTNRTFLWVNKVATNSN